MRKLAIVGEWNGASVVRSEAYPTRYIWVTSSSCTDGTVIRTRLRLVLITVPARTGLRGDPYISGGAICRVPLQSYMQGMSKSVYVLYCMVWYCRNFCFGRNLFSFFTFFTGPLVLRTGTVPARPPGFLTALGPPFPQHPDWSTLSSNQPTNLSGQNIPLPGLRSMPLPSGVEARLPQASINARSCSKRAT